DQLIEMLSRFRQDNPGAGLGGDFIVGYPGESESMFLETYRNIEKIGFSYGHVFRYSRRPGTKADLLTDQVAETIKSERSDQLRKLFATSTLNFINRLDGQVSRIIVESENPVRGITSNFIKIEVPGIRVDHNSWLLTRI